MWWFRRVITGILAIILMISLFALALSTSFDSAFSSPNHLKTWASSSDFYSSLVTKAASDTAAGLGNASLSSQLDPIVKQSLESVFPKSQLNQDIDTIIDSNYAWLKGNTTTPSFVVNVTSQKIAFASMLGTYVENRYQSLPKCTISQLASLSNTNPITAACQISSLSASTIKSEVASEVESSNIIVKNPVITAKTITRSNGKPYYSVVNAPLVYKHLKTAPIALAIVALICIAGIVFTTLRRRKSLMIVGFCFALVGLVLLVASTASNRIDTRISSQIAKHSGLSSFTTPISNLVHKIVYYIDGINLWFGLGYLLIALVLIALFLINRRRPRSAKSTISNHKTPDQSDTKPNDNIEPPRPLASRPKVQPTAPELKPASPRKKRILIQ